MDGPGGGNIRKVLLDFYVERRADVTPEVRSTGAALKTELAGVAAEQVIAKAKRLSES